MTTIPQEPPPAAEPAPRRTGRAWLAGALVYVGGLLVVLSLHSHLVDEVAGLRAE